MKMLIPLLCALSLTAGAADYNLNADWRFTWAKDTIPLAKARASVETGGVDFTAPDYNDADWQLVSVPHPVNAHDSFDGHALDAGEASFRRGMMFYRKRFVLGAECFVPGVGEIDGAPSTKHQAPGTKLPGKAFLTFETVRQTIYVWVNGTFAGYYEAGIAPTAYDVSSLLKEGENVIAVATDNCAARGTKLFSVETIPDGSHEPGDLSGAGYQWNSTDFNEVQGGLVGNVKLVLKPTKTYLTLPYYNNLKTVGTYVTASDFDFAKGAATVRVRAQVRNESATAQVCSLQVSVADADGRGRSPSGPAAARSVSEPYQIAAAKDAGKVFLTALEPDVYAKAPQPTRVNGPETATLEATGRVEGLTFWSPDTPHLYDVVVTLLDEKGAVLDSETIRTGFREVKYDADKGGLLINDKATWLPGYAQRATDEWAAIGVAPDWLQDYDAALIRRSNASFIRWMHVAPKPAPVRACDKFGVVNAVPAGDKEYDTKGRQWAQRVEAMRDAIIFFRNSPSVLFWEAGNNQVSPAHMREMRLLKEALDPDGGRFMGCRTISTKEQLAEAEYVGTMLHRHETPAFSSMALLGRFMPMMETEYARQESPRRVWDDYTPPDYDYRGRYLRGGKKEWMHDCYDQTQEDFMRTTAKDYAEFYGARANGTHAKTYSAVAALCWTDSNQHGRNSFSENCRSSGRVDAVRLPKENFDVFRVMQSEDPAVMLVGHWSYPPLTKDTYWYPLKEFNGHFEAETGEKAQRDPKHKTVYAVGSAHCASVELIVNGKSKGVNTTPKDVFVYEFPNIDVTESGTAEVVARDKDGREIARHTVRSFEGKGAIKAKVMTGPKGWLADGSDIAVVDFARKDANGTVHPYASDRLTFRLEGDATFMGGYNSGTYDETSPVGKDWVNLECGVARVFIKAGRTAGKVLLTWRTADGHEGGTWELETRPVASKGGILADPSQSFPANTRTFARKTNAPAVQDVTDGGAVRTKHEVFVNGKKVEFPKGLGAPTKPDDNTGVVCAYVPVLEALKAAGADFEFTASKKIPGSKKWLRQLSPTPYAPTVTVKAGGREIDACVGFTELFIDNGKEKNLTNCEVFDAKAKHGIVCGELSALVGYIPGVAVKAEDNGKRVDITVSK